MKKLITFAMVLMAGVALANPDEKKKPEGGKGKGGNPIAKLDTDKDGSVSKAEWEAGPMHKKDAERAGKIFAKIDADSDGKLSKEEIAKAAAARKGKGKGADGKGKKPEGKKPEGGKKPEKKDS